MNIAKSLLSIEAVGLLSCALALALSACTDASTNKAPQNAAAASSTPPAQQDAAPAAPPAQSQSLAELVAPANAPAPDAASSSHPLGNNPPAPSAPPVGVAPAAVPSPTSPPNAPPSQQAPLASTNYAPHRTTHASAQRDAAEYAQVISVTPLRGTQRVCTDQVVTERRPQSDDHQVAGTVIGAHAGAVVGNQLGRGNGRRVTTVAGAIGGGIAGKKIQEAHQNNDTVTHVVKRCRDVVSGGKEGPQLYDVIYAYQGQNLHAKLDYDPGSRIALPVHGMQ